MKTFEAKNERNVGLTRNANRYAFLPEPNVSGSGNSVLGPQNEAFDDLTLFHPCFLSLQTFGTCIIGMGGQTPSPPAYDCGHGSGQPSSYF